MRLEISNTDLSPQAPLVPSKAIIVKHLGVVHCEYHHGTALEYYIDCCGLRDFAKELDHKDLVDGVYVWEGDLHSSRDYFGEYDEWLDGALRPITKEEWKDHVNDNVPWDYEALQKLQKWRKKEDEKFQDELTEKCRCKWDCPTHHQNVTKRDELMTRMGKSEHVEK